MGIDVIKIAHRGNIDGPKEKYENEPSYILEALQEGYHVELDVWLLENKIFLGHDIPEYLVDVDFLKNNKFWCHCKNIDALNFLLKDDIRCFFHNTDDATLTSDGYIWTYPGGNLFNKSICVMPERTGWNIPDYVTGVCSDFISKIGDYIA